jgi:hypothetical protein
MLVCLAPFLFVLFCSASLIAGLLLAPAGSWLVGAAQPALAIRVAMPHAAVQKHSVPHLFEQAKCRCTSP